MTNKAIIPIVFVVLLGLFGWGSLYIVLESQTGIILRFGSIVEDNIKPGLHFKWPVMDNVKLFDKRLVTLETPNVRFLTQDQKWVMVDAYARWRVVDPAKYYTSVHGAKSEADNWLSRRLDASLRNQFGNKDLTDLVQNIEKEVNATVNTSPDKTKSGRTEVMSSVTGTLNKMGKEELGIEVIDIRIKAIDLPKEVYDSVFARMRSDRAKEAQKYRAQGRETAERIRAEADRQKQVILAKAYSEAEKIRGTGDAQAANIYAKAYSKSPEFYNFYRSLQAYRESFQSKNDVLVLDPNSDFFKYLQKVAD